MRKLLAPFIVVLLILCLFAESLLAAFTPAKATNFLPSSERVFLQQALIGRLAGMVIFGKNGNSDAHQPVHSAYRDLIGADTGGDLHLMSRMFRYLDRVHANTFGPTAGQKPRDYRIHDLVVRYSQPLGSDDAALIAVIREDAEQLLRDAKLPLPSGAIQIVFIDLPKTPRGRRFVEQYIEPEKGVRAIHYERVIVMRREDLTAERLAEEMGEIALMELNPTLHWTQAHDIVNTAGIGRGAIIGRLNIPTIHPSELTQAQSNCTQAIFAESFARLLAAHDVRATSGLIADLITGMERYEKLRQEGTDAVGEIAKDEIKKDGITEKPGVTTDASLDAMWEWFKKMVQTTPHMSSDEEIAQETIEPVLVRHRIESTLRPKLLKELSTLMNQGLLIEVVLTSAGGKPIGNVIRDLKGYARQSELQAERIAVEFVHQLGWTDAQIAEALRTASLASSQNEIGADVGDDDNALQKSIDELDLNTRTRNLLRDLGAGTIGDVRQLTERQIRERRRYAGDKTVQSINTALVRYGYSLRPYVTQNILTEPVNVLELSVRAQNVLRDLGAETDDDVRSLTEVQILDSYHSGKATLHSIRSALAKHNLSIRSDIAPRLREIVKLLSELGDAVPNDLNPSEQAVLEQIKQGELNVQRIAQTLGLSATTVYNLYDRVAGKLFVQKKKDLKLKEAA